VRFCRTTGFIRPCELANIERVTVLKAENDAPVGYCHAPHALEVALERVEAIARQIEIGRLLCLVQVSQHVRNPPLLVGADLALVSPHSYRRFKPR